MDKKELHAWGQRLDSGNTGDATLELAEQLIMHRSPSANPSTEFKLSLKNQLLAASGEKTAQRASLFWRWAATLIVAVILAVGLFAGLNPIIQEPQPVSAAEILQRANQAYISQIQSGEVLHTKFNLAWGPFMSFNTFGEQWLHADGELFRSQLTNKDGILFYFAQSNGEIVWRSVHKQEIGSMPVYSVYALSPEQYLPLYLMPSNLTPLLLTLEITEFNSLAPLFGDISDWIEFDQWILLRNQDCEDLYCLLGLVDSAEWECDQTRCMLPLRAPWFDAPEALLEVRVKGTEATADGRTAFIIEFLSGWDGNLLRTLKFDTENFAMLEILAHWKNRVTGNYEVSARMTFLEREFLPMTEELLQSFSIVPDSLEVIPYEENADLTIPEIPYASLGWYLHGEANSPASRASGEVFSSSPPQGSTLSGRVEIVLFVRHWLSVPGEAILTVRVCDSAFNFLEGSIDEYCSGLPEVQVRVSYYQDNSKIRITLVIDESWPESVGLLFLFEDEDGGRSMSFNPEFFFLVEP